MTIGASPGDPQRHPLRECVSGLRGYWHHVPFFRCQGTSLAKLPPARQSHRTLLTSPAMPEHRELLPEPLPTEALEIVARWLAEAWAARTQPNPNSMVLATASRDGRASARVVLCKDIVPQPGFVVFYTNYLSSKGRQLKDNPRAAAVMHW